MKKLITITLTFFLASLNAHYVYYLYNKDKQFIYVGETNNLDRRMGEHTNSQSAYSHPNAKYYALAATTTTEEASRDIESQVLCLLQYNYRSALPIIENQAWPSNEHCSNLNVERGVHTFKDDYLPWNGRSITPMP